MSTPPKRIEVLAIGDELLDGRVADTNTLRLAQALAKVGAKLAQRTTVPDDKHAIIREARAIAGRGCKLCVVSGGLGPTADDITADAFAELVDTDLVRDDAIVARITERIESRGRTVTPNQLRQAERPRGSTLVHNPVGLAAGFSLQHGGCRFVAVPGVPREFDVMVEAAVVADLSRARSGPAMLRETLCSFGLAEGEVDARLREALRSWPSVRVGYRVSFPEIHVTLQAPSSAAEALNEAMQATRQALGKAVFTERGEAFAEVVVAMLRRQGATVALAESCTGGLAADMLTDVPGSSDVFTLGVVAYANSAKQSLLGVREDALREHGAVSEAVVQQMALGVRQRAASTYGVAISGIAGPGGGSDEKPVGTIWLALSGPEPEQTRTRCISLPFDRRGNKTVSAFAALDQLRRRLVEN